MRSRFATASSSCANSSSICGSGSGTGWSLGELKFDGGSQSPSNSKQNLLDRTNTPPDFGANFREWQFGFVVGSHNLAVFIRQFLHTLPQWLMSLLKVRQKRLGLTGQCFDQLRRESQPSATLVSFEMCKRLQVGCLPYTQMFKGNCLLT